MVDLGCDVDSNLRVVIVPSTSEDLNGTFELRLCRKDTNATYTTRPLNWPSSEPQPDEISFDANRGYICIKGSTTLAEIPFSLRAAKLSAVSKEELTQRFQRFQKFDKLEQSQQAYNSLEFLSILLDFANNSDNEKTWSKLKKRAKSSTVVPSLNCQLSQQEQWKLLEMLGKKVEASSFSLVCQLLSSSNIFGYRTINKFASLLTQTNQEDLLLDTLRQSALLVESLYVRILEVVARESDDEKSRGLLQELLQRSFSEKILVEEATALGPELVAILLDRLVDRLCHEKRKDVQVQIVRLLGCLLDSSGSRLIWNDGSHEKILRCAGVLGDMASLIDTFLSVEEMRSRVTTAYGMKRVAPYVLRRISLVPITTDASK